MGVLKREISLGAVFFIIPRLLHLQCGRSSAFDDLVNGQISAIVNCRSAYIQTKIIQITVLYNFIFFYEFFFSVLVLSTEVRKKTSNSHVLFKRSCESYDGFFFFQMTNRFCVPCISSYAKGERLNTANSELASVCHSSSWYAVLGRVLT